MEEPKPKSDLAKQEEEILKFWQENKIFEQTLTKPAPNGEFVFYDGPPFATGLPHFGHLLPTSIKDAIPRYQTMRGKRVHRQWGWDCHGLPVENLVEKELNLKTKKDIEKYGLALFNQKARESVFRYADEWKKIIPRLGRWVDMENDYKTLNPSYTESVWWVFKTLFDKGLVYEGYKSMHLCPRCETTLANFEVNLGYKDITDISVYVKFELVDEPGTYLLAWTTTPWTLPGNAALAVKADLEYSVVESLVGKFILNSNLVAKLFPNDTGKIISSLSGKDLVGKKYKPPFNYYQGSTLKDAQGRTLNQENGWQVYSADFVTTEEGTGIVHIAPAFGEDDMRLGTEKKLPFIQHVVRDGKFKPEVTDFAGLPVKPKDDPSSASGQVHQSTDILIIKYLAGKGLLFGKEKIVHSYPHCWRCDTPLLNYAATSWFIKVTDLKDKLLSENQEVNWIPEHIRDGRFGKWLAQARDWAVSRQRFWGAPLPVWQCAECKKSKLVGSLEELKENTKTSGNQYFVMRHGEAENNVLNVLSSRADNPHHLTAVGQKQVTDAVRDLKKKKIDLVISSDFLRTKETAEIVAKTLGLKSESIIYDARLREVNHGDLNGQSTKVYHDYFKTDQECFIKRLPNGENFSDIKRRMGDALYDLETKYQNKKILVVTHESPSWLLFSAAAGADVGQAIVLRGTSPDFLKNAEVRQLDFVPIPHNVDYELDFHRPGIDAIKLNCACQSKSGMKRIEDVFDVWFESGAMPYGQVGYPLDFARGKPFQTKKLAYPADFIAEGVDQTRGWFYSLLVLGVGLFDRSPYKNVVVNGLILAEDGQKMSKRFNNYPDLNLTINKYGADALRFYLLSSPAVRAEEFGFSERGLGEVMRRVIMRLKNVLAFYQLYAPKNSPVQTEPSELSSNLLDVWIKSRLGELNQLVAQALDAYEVDKAGKPIDEFIDDFSTWYLRRSRERFKSEDEKIKIEALTALREALLTLAKIIAPIIPFVAEEIYQALRSEVDSLSVHLESWPVVGHIDTKLISQMVEVRQLVSMALEERSKAGIKVRQPLATLFVRGLMPADLTPEFISLIKDEVNVKEVKWQTDLAEAVKLDLEVTAELRSEGERRDFIRQIQDLRKQSGLSPQDRAILFLPASHVDRVLVETKQTEICRAVGVTEIRWLESEAGLPRLERV